MAVELPAIRWCTPPADYPEGWPVPSVGDMENYRIGQSVGLVAIHHEVLRTASTPVSQEMIGPDGLLPVEQELEGAIAALQEHGRPVAGLAAQQVGVGLNIVRARLGSRWITLRNATIVDQSDKTSLDTEGCHSCGPMGGFLWRPNWVEVVSDDEHGEPGQPVLYQGFEARVVSHELDHPQGIRVPDRLMEQEREIFWIPAESLRTMVGERSVYRTYYAQRGEWPFVVVPDMWQQFQTGALRMDDFTPPPAASEQP